jgi:hypothetical protein
MHMLVLVLACWLQVAYSSCLLVPANCLLAAL